MNYIDLFAGAGGLSEGFINSGFTPIAHLEMDSHACDTLKTRIQSFPDDYYFEGGRSAAFRQIGNAIDGSGSRKNLW